MLNQIAIGTGITLISIVFGSIVWWSVVRVVDRTEDWFHRPPHAIKTMTMFAMVITCTMLIMTFGVWLWAVVFVQLTAFPDLEDAVYYSLVAYTTLGLGDVTVPEEWRLLGGMTGANGFLMFGLMTAMLTDAIRDIRRMRERTPS